MNNKIKNFYELVPQEKKKEDKYFKNHYILPNSLIALIGGTGSGKSQFLLNFLERAGPKFYEIIIYTTDPEEKLMTLLKKKIPEAIITNDINDIPNVIDYATENDKEKEKEKLIVFDDFITLKGKELKKLQDYSISGRKFGFTMIFMAQNYLQLDKTIRRNLNYIVLFHLNDNSTIQTIVKNHNIHDVKKELFYKYYDLATKEKFNFLLVDLKGDKNHFLRHNFLEFYKI